METRGRVQNGNGDGSGDENESSSGDGNGDESGNRMGTRTGSGRAEVRRTSTKKRTRVVDAIRHFVPHASSSL